LSVELGRERKWIRSGHDDDEDVFHLFSSFVPIE
jgi:hypothetical protein